MNPRTLLASSVTSLLLLVIHSATAHADVKVGPKPKDNVCVGKKNFYHLAIPRDNPSKITHAVQSNGVVMCVNTKPMGTCHIQMADGAQMDLSPKGTIGVGDDNETITLTCTNGAKECFATICD